MDEHVHSIQPIQFKDFIPLIVIYSLVFMFVGIKQLIYGYDIMLAMRDFMGALFVIFGGFKLINIRAFAEAYSSYDIIAKRSRIYGYVYPFLEVILGILFLKNLYPFYTAVFTILLMAISSIGVLKVLMSKETITCACLGVVFKIPMTYVTLLENVLMLVMALAMLFMQ